MLGAREQRSLTSDLSASDNLPLIKGQSASGVEWRGRDRRPPCVRRWHPDRHTNGLSRRCKRHPHTPVNEHIVTGSLLICQTEAHTGAKIKSPGLALTQCQLHNRRMWWIDLNGLLFDSSLWAFKGDCCSCTGFTHRLLPYHF